MKRNRTRVTASDVARSAGVSQAAVSLALRGSSEVSAALTERIRKLARSMNYYPNAAGQLLRARRGGGTGQLGLIVASPDRESVFTNPFYVECVGKFIHYCSAKGLRYAIESHHHAEDEAGFVPPHHAASGVCDGSLVIGDVGDMLREWLDQQAGYPWVSVYESAEYCVLSADDEGMLEAMRRLVELGHRRIACNIGPQRYLTHRLRLEGFRRAAREFKLEIPAGWINTFDTSIPDSVAAYQWAGELFCAANRPTAIVAGTGGQGILYRAAESGLAVPRDLSVMGWASAAAGAGIYPQLSVIEADLALMMRSAVELLSARIEQRKVQTKVCRIAPRIVMAQSVGIAAKKS